MITSLILLSMMMLVRSLLTLVIVPIPGMPQQIVDYAHNVFPLIGQATSFVSYLFSPALLVAIFTLWIALMNFELIYNMIFWVVRKIPGGVRQ